MQGFSFFSQRLGFGQLVGMGIHVGHSLENSSLFSSWMLYGYRAGVCLINLFKFVTMLRFGLSVLNLRIALGRPLWFVNKDKAFARYVSYYALKCGEFSSTLFWIRGMLSNFRVVGRLAKGRFGSTDLARGRKFLLLDKSLGQWFLTRFTWPGLVFLSSVTRNYFVVNESFSAAVPCMGIADSDALVQGCSIAVPGNDDSLDSAVFYHDLMAEYVLYRKFSQVYLWFLNVRRAKRLVGFYGWLFLKKKALASLDLGFFFSSQLRQKYALGKVALGFFFAQGSWCDYLAEQLKVYREEGLFKASAGLDGHEKILGKYYYFFSFFFFSRLWRRKGKFLLSRRSRKHWRIRYRSSTFMFLRKNQRWRTFRFRRAFRYIGRLYSFRKGALGYRRFLLRFIHYYFFLYYLYFHSLRFYRAKYRRYRRKRFRLVSKRFMRREFRLYWRYFRKLFRRHWNYESTLRLGTTRQRSKLFRRRFAIFHVLFKGFHEPLVKRIVKQRQAKALKARPKGHYWRPVRVKRFVHIRFPLWRRWYRKASRRFFLRRWTRRKQFFNLLLPHLGWSTRRPAEKKRRRQLLGRLHGLVRQGAARYRRKLLGRLRLRRFLRTLKGAVLRFMLYGFFRPALSQRPLFGAPGVFYRDLRSAAAFGFRKGLGLGRRKRPRRVKKFYRARSRSLLFRGRKRQFFMGYIPFGTGTRPLQQLAPAYDFSLGFLKLSFYAQGPRRSEFFLGRSVHKARKALTRKGPRRPRRRGRRTRALLLRAKVRARKLSLRSFRRLQKKRRLQKRRRRRSLGTLGWVFNKRYL